MHLSWHLVGRTAVIHIEDRRLDATNADHIRNELSEVLDTHPVAVLDIQKIHTIDSSGLRTLLSCLEQSHNTHGTLILCGVSKSVQTFLQVVRLHKVFSIHPDLEGAMHSLNQGALIS